MLRSVKKFVELVDLALAIVNNEALTWEDKYELVFSAEVRVLIKATGHEADWYDPDMDYQDDVMAYVEAQKDKADRYRTLLVGGIDDYDEP